MTTSATSKRKWLDLMKVGERDFQQGKLSKAVQAFTRATNLQPERVEGWINLGSSLFESKRYDVALDAALKAVAMRPGLMVGYLLLGDSLRMLGRWREASASYHRAVALQRTPTSLNKLACALRAEGKPELAEGLYCEAIEMEHGSALARVNLATLQIELRRYDKAAEQLRELAQLSLPPAERREVEYAQFVVAEHGRLDKAITAMVEHNNTAPLEAALRLPALRSIQLDEGLMASLQRYADAARHISNERVVTNDELPEEWPLIEAMLMIPLAKTIDEYQAVKAELKQAQQPSNELLQLSNRESAIQAARACQLDMLDPVKAELHLRHWHALVCKQLAGLQPGHFKYTQNWIRKNPSVRRVEPALASATYRHFVGEIYSKLAPGYARAVVVYMAMIDLHLFADGNGRIAWIWLNRELEWAGLMPGLFHKQLGLQKALGESLRAARSNGGDLSPMVAVITKAQDYARDFCAELALH